MYIGGIHISNTMYDYGFFVYVIESNNLPSTFENNLVHFRYFGPFFVQTVHFHFQCSILWFSELLWKFKFWNLAKNL